MPWNDTARVEHRRNCSDYPSDLTDQEWALIAPLLPPAKPGGRPRTTDLRAVVEAILNLVRAARPDGPEGAEIARERLAWLIGPSASSRSTRVVRASTRAAPPCTPRSTSGTCVPTALPTCSGARSRPKALRSRMSSM